MQWLLTIQLLAAIFGVVRTQDGTQRNGVATTCDFPPVVGFTGSVYAPLDKNLAAQQLQKNVFHFSNATVSFEAMLLFSLESYVLPHLTAICMPSIIIFTFLLAAYLPLMVSRGCAPEVCCKPRKSLTAYTAPGCDGWVCSLMQWLLTLVCILVSIAFAWLGFQQMAPILVQAPCMTDHLMDDATQLIASISSVTNSTGTTLDEFLQPMNPNRRYRRIGGIKYTQVGDFEDTLTALKTAQNDVANTWERYREVCTESIDTFRQTDLHGGSFDDTITKERLQFILCSVDSANLDGMQISLRNSIESMNSVANTTRVCMLQTGPTFATQLVEASKKLSVASTEINDSFAAVDLFSTQESKDTLQSSLSISTILYTIVPGVALLFLMLIGVILLSCKFCYSAIDYAGDSSQKCCCCSKRECMEMSGFWITRLSCIVLMTYIVWLALLCVAIAGTVTTYMHACSIAEQFPVQLELYAREVNGGNAMISVAAAMQPCFEEDDITSILQALQEGMGVSFGSQIVLQLEQTFQAIDKVKVNVLDPAHAASEKGIAFGSDITELNLGDPWSLSYVDNATQLCGISQVECEAGLIKPSLFQIVVSSRLFGSSFSNKCAKANPTADVCKQCLAASCAAKDMAATLRNLNKEVLNPRRIGGLSFSADSNSAWLQSLHNTLKNDNQTTHHQLSVVSAQLDILQNTNVNCKSLKTNYFEAHDAVCNKALPGAVELQWSLFGIATFSGLLVFLTIFVQVRLGGVGQPEGICCTWRTSPEDQSPSPKKGRVVSTSKKIRRKYAKEASQHQTALDYIDAKMDGEGGLESGNFYSAAHRQRTVDDYYAPDTTGAAYRGSNNSATRKKSRIF